MMAARFVFSPGHGRRMPGISDTMTGKRIWFRHGFTRLELASVAATLNVLDLRTPLSFDDATMRARALLGDH